ncbi:UNVERIFIED_CONTAM: hypothetical protein K2H54_040966 [Gekko kuhli]
MSMASTLNRWSKRKMWRCSTCSIVGSYCSSLLGPYAPQSTQGEHDRDDEDEAEQERRVAEIIIHEQYIPKKTDNDIALLRLDKPVNFTDYVVPICLPEQGFAVEVLSSIKFSTGHLVSDKSHDSDKKCCYQITVVE